MTFDPDIIVVAEMKDKEAYAAQEAARTGHAVITTVHAKSAEATYSRMCTLCMLKHSMDYQIVDKLVREAFPIVVYAKKLEDKKRHIMTIAECVIDEHGRSHINILWKYKVISNEYDSTGKCVIEGYFEKVNNISDTLVQHMLENGTPKTVFEKFVTEKGVS